MSDHDLEALRDSLRTSISTDKPKDKGKDKKSETCKDPDKVQMILSEITNISQGLQEIKGVLGQLVDLKPIDLGSIHATLSELQTQQELLKTDVKKILQYLGYKDPIE